MSMERGGRAGARRIGVGLALLLAAGLALAAVPGARGDRIRTIEVRIHFSHFETGRIDVRPGELVRFVVRNTDPIDHEFIVGDERVQLVHELGTERHHGAKPGEISVPALSVAETTYRFPNATGTLLFGCHLPGHYAYGMRGVIRIG